MTTDELRLEISEGIATVTLARPKRLNSLTFEVYAELRDLFPRLEQDDAVKVVILTGEGKGFCSGGDVHQIIGELVAYGPKDMLGFARMTGEVIKNMRRLHKPIIAAVNGMAAGAGAVLALASDFRLASSEARFAFLFTRVGLTGADMGAAYLLPRVIGLGRATELLMLGDDLAAVDALRVGLVGEVVEPARLLERARELATRLASGPSFSLGMTKELLNNGMNMDLFSAIDAEARAQTICMLADDFKEFHRAFSEKRAPQFRGQ